MIVAGELGSIAELEARFERAEAQTPEGQEKLREVWGTTPEAVAGQQAAEAMFGPG